MRRQQFSFLEISQDPLLTILALVLVGTVWLILPGGSRAPEEQPAGGTVLEAEVQSLEDRMRVLDAELQALTDERKRLEGLLASVLGEPGEQPDVKLLDRQIALLLKQREERQKERADLEEQLRKARSGSGPAGQETTPALFARMEQLMREVRRLEEELAELDRQILVAQQAQAGQKAEADKRKQEIARLQNERRAKEQLLAKLRDQLKPVESKRGFRGRVPFSSKKPKSVDIQLVDNHLFPVDDDHFEVIKEGYIQRGGRSYPAVVKGPRRGVKGDDLNSVGLPQSSLSKFLAKLNPKDTRVMIYVDGKSFPMLEKALSVVDERGFEVGWWPDDDVTFTESAAPRGDVSERPSLERMPK